MGSNNATVWEGPPSNPGGPWFMAFGHMTPGSFGFGPAPQPVSPAVVKLFADWFRRPGCAGQGAPNDVDLPTGGEFLPEGSVKPGHRGAFHSGTADPKRSYTIRTQASHNAHSLAAANLSG